MINYNNLCFIHYLNLAFESTQQECRKSKVLSLLTNNCFIAEVTPVTEKKGLDTLSYDIET